jgi:hypothetical protein
MHPPFSPIQHKHPFSPIQHKHPIYLFIYFPTFPTPFLFSFFPFLKISWKLFLFLQKRFQKKFTKNHNQKSHIFMNAKNISSSAHIFMNAKPHQPITPYLYEHQITHIICGQLKYPSKNTNKSIKKSYISQEYHHSHLYTATNMRTTKISLKKHK